MGLSLELEKNLLRTNHWCNRELKKKKICFSKKCLLCSTFLSFQENTNLHQSHNLLSHKMFGCKSIMSLGNNAQKFPLSSLDKKELMTIFNCD